MKKGCLIAAAVGVVLVLAAAAVVFFVFRLTAPLADEGDKFLAALGSGAVEEAYGRAAEPLRASQSQDEFARAVKGFGLDGFESATWLNRRIKNDRGFLEGTARTKGGGAVPLTLELVREQGAWKVLSIRGPQPGAAAGPTAGQAPATPPPPAPPPAEAAQLALASLLAFNAAVQAQSFDTFHSGLSTVWREQITPARLLEIFQPFIDAKIDLAPIKAVEPAFKSPPAVNADGVLLLEGHYPTQPNKVYFTLKYLSDGGRWKLCGVNVNVDE